MALNSASQLFTGLHRFGFGPRASALPGGADGRDILIADLDNPNSGRLENPSLISGGEAIRAVTAERGDRLQRRRATSENASAKRSDTMKTEPGKEESAQAMDTDRVAQRAASNNKRQQLYFLEAQARLDAALAVETGFVERLVWFWSNHFCVSADKGLVRALCGPLEREAIRPHVLGRFRDMLIAVETHPAMLLYLDNARSIGPNSPAGRNRSRGLNENLAREILELHTLGVRTVYTQANVTNLAKVITGWGMLPVKQDPQRGGEFYFNPHMHEPGAQVVLGKTYADNGGEQGRAVLADIARHPATARHVATKLAVHFVSDTPPASLVERLAKRFLDTDGNLKEVAKTLVSSTESWDAPRAKLKRPSEWMVGALRAGDARTMDVRLFIQALNIMGEPLWRPPSPKGFSDESATWIGGVTQRVDAASRLAREVQPGEVTSLTDRILGPLASDDTRLAVARAADRSQAFALLIMAPEFQRR